MSHGRFLARDQPLADVSMRPVALGELLFERHREADPVLCDPRGVPRAALTGPVVHLDAFAQLGRQRLHRILVIFT